MHNQHMRVTKRFSFIKSHTGNFSNIFHGTGNMQSSKVHHNSSTNTTSDLQKFQSLVNGDTKQVENSKKKRLM